MSVLSCVRLVTNPAPASPGKVFSTNLLDPVVKYRGYDGAMQTSQNPTSWTRKALAGQAGIGAEALRFYEGKGLIKKPVRSESNYRLYGQSDLDRLNFIQRAQDLGFSLQDIKQLLELTGDIKTPRKAVRTFAEARLAVIRQKIRDLRAMEKSLSGLLTKCDGKGAIKGCPIVEFIGGSDANPNRKNCHE